MRGQERLLAHANENPSPHQPKPRSSRVVSTQSLRREVYPRNERGQENRKRQVVAAAGHTESKLAGAVDTLRRTDLEL
jgi:hypothetical protein